MLIHTKNAVPQWLTLVANNGYAGVMELVDMRDLGSRVSRRGGSSSFTRTKLDICPQSPEHTAVAALSGLFRLEYLYSSYT